MTQAMRMLLAEGVISRDELERALTQKAARGGSASQHLVEADAIGSEELTRFMARRFPIPRWQRQRIALVPPLVLAAIPAALARSLRVLPVARREDGTLTVAIVDPTETHALEEATRAAGTAVETVLVSEADMAFALEHHYGRERPPIEPRGEVPLPLTRRITRRMAVVTEDAAEPVPRPQPTGGTIAEALDAIPLVRRIVTAPPGSPAPAPAPAAPKSPRPDYDTWQTGPSFSSPPDPVEPGGCPTEPAAPAPTRTLSEGEIIAAIGEAVDRDAVVSLAIGYLKRFASRAAFFTVKRDEIRGFDIVDDLGHREAARSFWIPFAAPSTLRRVAEERRVYAGSLDKTSADAVLSAALGGRPERVIVLPIVLKGKTAGLLMADGFYDAFPPRARLERLCDAVAEVFTKMIARGRDR
jgi:hypothetical protein